MRSASPHHLAQCLVPHPHSVNTTRCYYKTIVAGLKLPESGEWVSGPAFCYLPGQPHVTAGGIMSGEPTMALTPIFLKP